MSYIPWPETSEELSIPSIVSSISVTPERRVTALACAFFLIFAAFSTAQLLESSLNGSSGLLCLLSLYGVFAISAASAPWLISKAGAGSATIAMALAALPYAIMVALNLMPVRISWMTYIACAAVGAGAGPLWAAQGLYVGTAAMAHSKESDSRNLSQSASYLNARFYFVFMFSGVISNSIASLIMVNVKEPEMAVKIMFAVLTAAAGLGILCISGLEEASAPDELTFRKGGICSRRKNAEDLTLTHSETLPPLKSQVTAPHPLSVIYMMIYDSRLPLLLPASFASGALAGFILGPWISNAISLTVGTEYVGIGGAVYSGTAVSFSRLWALLASRKQLGRRFCFAIANLVLIGWLAVTAIVWKDTADVSNTPPIATPGRVVSLLAALAVVASTDPVSNAFISATAQTFYPDSNHLTAGLAATKVAYCFGFAAQQGIALSAKSITGGGAALSEQAIFLCLVQIFAAISLSFLHFRVKDGHIDGGGISN